MDNAPAADALTFAELGLADGVLAAVTAAGYETPSAIQAATIPLLLQGRDVVGLAQTGTGKTAAFALPILSQLDLAVSAGAPQALVLAPTRELALQVAEAFEGYASQLPSLKVLPIYGGQGYGPQLTALRRGVHVVVGTPGRIMDHLAKGTLDLSELRFLVLDEADEMLNMGFAEDVETILADTPATKQVALFSATMPPMIRKLSQKYLNDPEEVQVKSATKTNANITQRYLMCSYPQKVDALTRILEVENFEAMIVFTRTKSETDSLAEKLRARGFSASAINGDVAQVQREKTVNQLKDGSLDILVATDVAARGLDVERISHVINYDLPTDLEAYVHRIGRTGRAGRKGDAISFVTPRERYLLKAIEKHTKAAPVEMKLPSADEVNATRLSRFDDGITAALSDEKVAFFRDVVSHYVREHNVPELDVAAALAVVLNGAAPLLLEDQPEPVRRERPVRDDRDERPQRGDRFDRDRPGRDARPNRDNGQPMQQYRIEVGKRHRVEPRQVVGALANEGGLRRQDFGNITIKEHFSIVELPQDLDPAIWAALEQTRISGKLIELSVDKGPNLSAARGGDRRPRRDFGDKPAYGGDKSRTRKPRH
ncbi:ATP-dependent RNA helicase DeaD [Nocardioides baekrokdamisoli]|uniref:ATP-dependent RNA helicase DeaD n=1 Tax=Nocardioides baekrokdamisoli TaxID=1804624 RepID=A0A3G9INJ6_9ACTN|nr:DEAD/DEAH box helicase [Nocardioides baekrokdamisoli]BBH17605.1 ATP-dependent RNA helicase DeaD [Nocardioides baekrokdamisoli]